MHLRARGTNMVCRRNSSANRTRCVALYLVASLVVRWQWASSWVPKAAQQGVHCWIGASRVATRKPQRPRRAARGGQKAPSTDELDLDLDLGDDLASGGKKASSKDDLDLDLDLGNDHDQGKSSNQVTTNEEPITSDAGIDSLLEAADEFAAQSKSSQSLVRDPFADTSIVSLEEDLVGLTIEDDDWDIDNIDQMTATSGNKNTLDISLQGRFSAALSEFQEWLRNWNDLQVSYAGVFIGTALLVALTAVPVALLGGFSFRGARTADELREYQVRDQVNSRYARVRQERQKYRAEAQEEALAEQEESIAEMRNQAKAAEARAKAAETQAKAAEPAAATEGSK